MTSVNLDVFGEKGISFTAEKTNTRVNTVTQGLKLNLFGYSLIDPETENGWDAFSGIQTSASIGYSRRRTEHNSESSVHGNLKSDYISLKTGGSNKGSEINLKGNTINGLNQEKIKQFSFDTAKLILGGTQQKQNTDDLSFGFNVGYDFATETPSVGGNIDYNTNQSVDHFKGVFLVEIFENRRSGAEVKIEDGVQFDVSNSLGEKYNLNIDHAQNTFSQLGCRFGLEISSKPSVGFGIRAGSKYSSEDTTEIKIASGNNFKRKDVKLEDSDTRFGIGFDISEKNVGVNLEYPDYSFKFNVNLDKTKKTGMLHDINKFVKKFDFVNTNIINNIPTLLKDMKLITSEQSKNIKQNLAFTNKVLQITKNSLLSLEKIIDSMALNKQREIKEKRLKEQKSNKKTESQKKEKKMRIQLIKK